MDPMAKIRAAIFDFGGVLVRMVDDRPRQQLASQLGVTLSRLDELVLVLGHAHQNILKKLGAYVRHPRLQVVVNHRYNEGQSRSLQAGLLEIRQTYPSAMFLLGD